jgi:hypothetical protein
MGGTWRKLGWPQGAQGSTERWFMGDFEQPGPYGKCETKRVLKGFLGVPDPWEVPVGCLEDPWGSTECFWASIIRYPPTWMLQDTSHIIRAMAIITIPDA